MSKLRYLLILFLCTLNSKAENIIDVAEGTLKIGALSEEVFYYGFAEGDQMIFTFREENKRELKEIEITELPSSVKFMDYKSKEIDKKTFLIGRTAIYKFRFSNSALIGRICHFKLQRIPADSKFRNFNCSVYWRTLFDTVYKQVTEDYLLRSDTAAIMVTDQIAKVSSQTAMNGNSNKSIVDFTLPQNTISWSYYIGVGNEGRAAYEQGKERFFNTASATLIKIPGYGALAALALQGINFFSKTPGEDNVKYFFITNWENVQAFEAGSTFYQYKQGDVVNDASQMRSPLKGKVYLGLLNDNIRDAIEVSIKITAITVQQVWDTRLVNKMHVSSRQEAYLQN